MSHFTGKKQNTISLSALTIVFAARASLIAMPGAAVAATGRFPATMMVTEKRTSGLSSNFLFKGNH